MLTQYESNALSDSVVMVTGAAGFIGSHVLEALSEYGCRVLAVDGLIESTYSSKIKKSRWDLYQKTYGRNFTFFEGDLAEEKFVTSLPAANYVVNLAALPGLMLSWQNLDLYLRSNIKALNNLIEYSKIYEIQNFVHASTSSVYGKYATCNEDGAKNPVSPYGVTKLAAENLILAHHYNFNFPHTILRYFSVYGPRQRPDMFYSIAIDKILKRETIEVFGDGEQTRSNTYVSEVANATVKSLTSPTLRNEIYNVASEETVSVNHAVKMIGNFLNLLPDVRYLPIRPGDQFETKGDASKILAAGVPLSKVTFEEGIILQIEEVLSERIG